MTRIEIYCRGRRLRSDDGSREYSHERELVDIFDGEPGRGWSSVLPDHRDQHVARLVGNEYIPPRRYGEIGRAAAAKRHRTPTPDQERRLESAPRQNLNLPCRSEKCRVKLSRHREDVERALDAIAAAGAIPDDGVSLTELIEIAAKLGS